MRGCPRRAARGRHGCHPSSTDRLSRNRTERVGNAVLSSLVSITATCACVSVGESLVIGALGALFSALAEQVERRMRIDDPCAAFPIHGVSGAWGVVAVGLFGEAEPCMGVLSTNGLFHGGGWRLLGIQVAGVAAMSLWSAVTCIFVLWVMYILSRHTLVFRSMVLRPSWQTEVIGFDETEHNIHRQESINPPVENMKEITHLRGSSKWQAVDVKSLIQAGRNLRRLDEQRAAGAAATGVDASIPEHDTPADSGGGVVQNVHRNPSGSQVSQEEVHLDASLVHLSSPLR